MTPSRARALAAMGGALLAAGTNPLGAQTLLPVRVGTSLSDPFLEPYYAQDQGFFTAAGLNAEVQALSNGNAVMAAILGGSLDTGNADLIQLANAANRGADLAIIASGAIYDARKPTISLCVNKNSPYYTAKDLEGQTIAVPNLKSTGGIAIQEWLLKNGADTAKVKFYEMLFPQMGPALQSNRVAAALNGEPFLTDAKNDIRRIADPYDYVAKNFYTGVWFAKRSWLNANVPAAKAFVKAIYQSGAWANGHQPDSAAIAARVTKVDVDKVRTFVRNTFATSFEAKYAQPLLDLALTYRLLEKPASARDLYWRPPA